MPHNNAPALQSAGTIGPSSFVKMGTIANTVLQAGAGDPIKGISQEAQQRTPGLPGSDTTIAATAGQNIRVYSEGDVCLLIIADTVTPGQYLKSDGSGFGIPAVSNDEVGAVALEGGATGNKILVQVLCRPAS